MAKTQELSTDGKLVRIAATEADWKKLEAPVARHMLFSMMMIREVELALLDLKDWGQIHGPVHSSIGQEGAAVGAMQSLVREDITTSTHRGHHHFLAKAYNAYSGNDFDPTEGIPDTIFDVTHKAIAEIMGLATGFCRGRGGSMHLGDGYSGCLGTNAIVAGGVALATGASWAAKLDERENVAVAFLGDGGVNQGIVHESMNMAALWGLPTIYFIENNLYAVATHVREATCVEHLAQRALAYDMLGIVVDGMDPLAVHLAMERAREVFYGKDSEFKGAIVEAETYRYRHQAQSLPGSVYGYRTKDEEAEWLAKDPLQTFPKRLVDLGLIEAKQVNALRKEAKAIVTRAVEPLTIPGEKKGTREVRLELFPPKEDLYLGVFSDGSEFDGAKYREEEDLALVEEKSYIDVVPEVIGRSLKEHPGTVILGEDVGHMKGGVYMATKGLSKSYGNQRIVDTPISEGGFMGLGLGLAVSGKRPIVELMYPDFALVAADQAFNQIGKLRYMYGNQYDVPYLLRTRVGARTGYGAQHSMDPGPLFAMFPGWRIVAPVTPADYIGLYNTAFDSLDPVLIIEHNRLYATTGMVPKERDYYIPFGKAKVRRNGGDVTIVAYSYQVVMALEAAETLAGEGVEAEVVDLRTVDYPHIDYATIGSSLEKTGRVVISEEGMISGGIGSQLATEIQDRFFDLLDAEIGRVAAKQVPIPVSRIPEERVLPSVEEIVAAAKRACYL